MPIAAFCSSEFFAAAFSKGFFQRTRRNRQKALPQGPPSTRCEIRVFLPAGQRQQRYRFYPAQILAASLYIAISTNEQYYLFDVLYIFYIFLASIKENAKSPKIYPVP